MTHLAVVLDMDGLMVDSEPLSRRAWDQVLGPYGVTLDDATYRGIIGFKTDDSAAVLIKAYNLPLQASDLAREKGDVLAKIRAQGVPPMPGLFEFHDQIAQHGLPWAVATSSPRAHAMQILEQLGLISSCRALAAGDEVARGKPAPDIYLLAAERLGISAKHCLAVEDSLPGCRAAQAAGMLVVAIPNGDTGAADFSNVDFVMPSLHHAAAVFDELLLELRKR